MKFLLRYVNIVCLIVFPLTLLAQEFSVVQQNKWNIEADNLISDNLGNLLIQEGNVLRKVTERNELIIENSSSRFGFITSIDATNALKPIVFFKDLNQVTFLDNNFAFRGETLELDRIEVFQVEVVCRSYNNAFWVFDPTLNELIRLDEQLAIQNRTGDLTQLLGPIQLTQLIERNQQVFALDPSKGIYVFDQFGGYTKAIHEKGIQQIQPEENGIFLLKSNELLLYNTFLNQLVSLFKFDVKVKQFLVSGDKLYLLTPKSILVYQIKIV